jgi:membrane associated rhomboid family serine protease
MISLTNIIITINIIVFIAQQYIQNMTILFGMNYLFISQYFWFQALTNIFLHGSLMHLVMNMIVLYQFGNIIEKNTSKYIFFIFFIIGGILTSILSLFFSTYFIGFVNIIGASGAISILLGVYALFDKNIKNLFIAILIMSFAPLLIGINIAWYAHIIGFIIGIIMGYIIKRIYYRV